MLGPILRGDSLDLHPTSHDDLESFRVWLANPEITRYLLTRFVPSAKAEEEWYERTATSDAVVSWSLKVNDRAIGNTAIGSIDWINRQGTTGLFIGERSEWGKGYASEAVRLRTTYAFNEIGLERLESLSVTENVPMHRALEKSGYQKVGLKRHHIFRNGTWYDSFIFEVLRDEWLATHGQV